MLVFNDFDDMLNDLLYVYDLYVKPNAFEDGDVEFCLIVTHHLHLVYNIIS